MKTKVTEMFGIETPIFAFSHCRDVVVEVTNAGGVGVLGTTRMSPEQLEAELKWIDDHTKGRPYALDLALPNKLDAVRPMRDREIALPKEHIDFVERILADAGIPPLPDDEHREFMESSPGYTLTSQGGMELIEVALKHPQIKLVVSALGIAPKEMIDLLHAKVGNGFKFLQEHPWRRNRWRHFGKAHFSSRQPPPGPIVCQLARARFGHINSILPFAPIRVTIFRPEIELVIRCLRSPIVNQWLGGQSCSGLRQIKGEQPGYAIMVADDEYRFTLLLQLPPRPFDAGGGLLVPAHSAQGVHITWQSSPGYRSDDVGVVQ